MLRVDDTSILRGTLIGNRGSLLAIPDAAGGGTVVLTNPIYVQSGANYLGSVGATILALLGALAGSGQGGSCLRGGRVALELTEGVPIAATLDGVTLEFVDSGSCGDGVPATIAGTSNTIVLGDNAANVSSNGADTIQLGSGNLTVNATSQADITGGTGTGHVNATGSSPLPSTAAWAPSRSPAPPTRS